MSLSFFLNSGRRTVLTLLPTLRTLGRKELPTGKNFHSLRNDNLKYAPKLLETKTSLTDNVRGMKTKGRLQLRCKDCYFVTRQSRRYVMCKTHGRHKQQQVMKKEENTWRLTFAMQSRFRPW